MCIKESMRLNSPVPSVSRLTTKDFELDGIVLPKGTPISLPIHLIHTNKAVWGEDALVVLMLKMYQCIKESLENGTSKILHPGY